MPSRARLFVTCCVKQSREKKIRKKLTNPKGSPPSPQGGSNGAPWNLLERYQRPPERPGDGKIRTFAAPPAPIAPGVSRKRENMCVTIATTAGGQIHAQTPGSEHHGHRAQNLSRSHSLRCGRKKAKATAKSNAERGQGASSKQCLSWNSHQNHGSPPRFGDEDQVKIRPKPDEFQKPEDILAPTTAAAAPPARQFQN